MPHVSNHLRRLASQLFEDAAEREHFIEALVAPRQYDRAVLWTRRRPEEIPFSRKEPFPWQPDFVDRAPAEDRPGLDPLHEQGFYYCLDFSSVFAAMAISVVGAKPQVLIDLCAAPGGKTVFAWRMLQPQMLIANEVIGKRTGILIANLERCGVAPDCVISRDSSHLAEVWPAAANVVIVDAPCSGQSLLARGKESPGCFHPATINMNSNRQKRILANAAKLVAPGGWLAYMTCTYSEKENEDVLRWLLRRFPQFVWRRGCTRRRGKDCSQDSPAAAEQWEGRRILRCMELEHRGYAMSLRTSFLLAAVLLLGCRPNPPDINQVGGVVLTYPVAEEGGATKEAMQDLSEVLKRRLDPTGARGVVIEPLGKSRVRISIPDPEALERAKSLIAAPGRMEFRIVANPQDHQDVIQAALDQNNHGAESVKDESGNVIGVWAKPAHEGRGGDGVIPAGAVLRNAATGDVLTDDKGSLRTELLPNENDEKTSLLEQFEGDDGDRVLRKHLKAQGIEEIEILLAADDGYDVQSSHLESVSASFDEAGFPSINFTMTDHGAILVQGLTGEYSPDPQTGLVRRIGIVFDNRLLTAPELRGVISRNGQITGRFTQEEIDNLVTLLRVGELPVRLDPMPEREERIAPKP